MKLNKMKFLYGFIAFFQVIANLPSMNIMEKVYKLKKNKMMHRWLEPICICTGSRYPCILNFEFNDFVFHALPLS